MMLRRLMPLVSVILLGGSGLASCQDKSAPFARGTVGKLLPIPAEFKALDVVAFFQLASAEGKIVAKARTVVVTVYQDSKVERIEGGKRVAAKASDIKDGQRIELWDLEEGVQTGDSMRVSARLIVIEDKKK